MVEALSTIAKTSWLLTSVGIVVKLSFADNISVVCVMTLVDPEVVVVAAGVALSAALVGRFGHSLCQ